MCRSSSSRAEAGRQSEPWHSLHKYDRTSQRQGRCKISKAKRPNTVEWTDERMTEMMVLCSCEVRSRSGVTSPPLHPPHPPALSLLSSLLLCSLSPLSLLLTLSVCCMLPWLFLEPDALCYLPVRPTNSGCCVCESVCYWMCGRVFFLHMRETECERGLSES